MVENAAGGVGVLPPEPATTRGGDAGVYVAWLKGLPHKPVFVAYPAVFNFTFVYWYLIRICRSHECALPVT